MSSFGFHWGTGHGDASEIRFSKCECSGGYDGDPQVFFNGLVMEMCLKSIFQNANVPAATMAILTDFFQCSGYGECV